MKSISGKQLCKIVEQKGWILKRITGSHHIYEKPEVNQILSIPVHRDQDLKDWNPESLDEDCSAI